MRRNKVEENNEWWEEEWGKTGEDGNLENNPRLDENVDLVFILAQ